MENIFCFNCGSHQFDCGSHQIEGINLSYLDSLKGNKVLHFYHANGFPVSVYIPFLERFTNHFRVVGLGQRGQDSQADGNTSWYRAAYDLIDFLDKQKFGPVTGAGHSIGGVATMVAACMRPDLFEKIVLIDPVLLPYRFIFMMGLIRIIGRKDLFILAKRARKRKNSWQNREEAYEYFKGKGLFKQFNDEFVSSYVTYGLKDNSRGGVELLCPPEAEARIFENYPLGIWRWTGKLKTQTLLIRGEYSDVLFDYTEKRFLRKVENSNSFVVKDSGHLLPMEKPDELKELILKFIL